MIACMKAGRLSGLRLVMMLPSRTTSSPWAGRQPRESNHFISSSSFVTHKRSQVLFLFLIQSQFHSTAR
jgi:hypothetical protein